MYLISNTLAFTWSSQKTRGENRITLFGSSANFVSSFILTEVQENWWFEGLFTCLVNLVVLLIVANKRNCWIPKSPLWHGSATTTMLLELRNRDEAHQLYFNINRYRVYIRMYSDYSLPNALRIKLSRTHSHDKLL